MNRKWPQQEKNNELVNDIDKVKVFKGAEYKVEGGDPLVVHQHDHCDRVHQRPVYAHAGDLFKGLCPGDHRASGGEDNAGDGVEECADYLLVALVALVGVAGNVECCHCSPEHKIELRLEITFENRADYGEAGGLEAEVDHEHLERLKLLINSLGGVANFSTQLTVPQCPFQRFFPLTWHA